MPYSVLIAREIDVTPPWVMAQRLVALGCSFEPHLGEDSTATAPLLDHDKVLSDAERPANTSISVCCSGSLSPLLVLDL